jgi:hypothetical protein
MMLAISVTAIAREISQKALRQLGFLRLGSLSIAAPNFADGLHRFKFIAQRRRTPRILVLRGGFPRLYLFSGRATRFDTRGGWLGAEHGRAARQSVMPESASQ